MKTYSIRDLCERYGWDEHTPLALIKSGELAALNVARSRGVRPRWRITQESLDAFEASRTSAAAQPTQSKRRKRSTDDQSIKFF